MMQGQIAHLDHNPSNNNISNLAFICLAHHDQYDSKTSQSKNLTVSEVKAFKQELEDYIHSVWSKPIIGIDEVRVDIFSGKYDTGGDNSSAELTIEYVGGGFVQVSGIAYYGKTSPYGPNFGELDFLAKAEGDKLIYTDRCHNGEYRLELSFLGHRLEAAENLVGGYFGFNVSFGGTYHRQA